MKKFFWAISIFLIIFAPARLSAQGLKELLVDCFNEALGLENHIRQLSGEVVSSVDRPLHWKVSGDQNGLVLEKGGNLSVPGILWYQVSCPKSGLKFFWTPDRTFGKIFTPAGNFLLESRGGQFSLSLDPGIKKINKKTLKQCRKELKNFKQ